MSWPEFQLRRAVRAGAIHLVLVADRVTRDVVEAVDLLREDGVATTLVRSNAEVADLFHPDEAVLVMTGGAIVDLPTMQALLFAVTPTVLCVDAAHAAPAHELIDARSHWVGLARIDGAQIRAIGPLAGEWDLGSTLLRHAVSAQASRTIIGPDQVLIDARTTAGAAAAADALVAAVDRSASGWGTRWLLLPLATLALRKLSIIAPPVSRAGSWGAIATFTAAPIVQLQTWTTAAMILTFVALLVATAVRVATAATGIPARAARYVGAVGDLAGIAVLAQLSIAAWPVSTPLVLSLGLLATIALADRLVELATGQDRNWIADRATHVVVLIIASAFGFEGTVVGLSVCSAFGVLSLAVLQRRLSQALTLPS